MYCILKFKKTAILLLAAGLGVAALVFSSVLRQGVLKGLALCAGSVIPSLFLFTAVALFFVKSGSAELVGRLISPVTRRVLGLNGNEATVFLISTVAGYPVGARLINSLYRDGKVTRSKALRLLTFSVNAGPAFILTVIGETVLKIRSDGLRLLAVHLLATLFLAVFARFLPDRFFGNSTKTAAPTALSANRLCFSDIFVLSVSEAGQTMLSICIFVVFFSAIGYAVGQIPLKFAADLGSLLEVTAGLRLCTRKTLPKAAFLLGFAGVSVIFQVKSAAESVNPPLLLIFASRLVHGALSAGLCVLAERIFPRELQVGSFNVQATVSKVHTSPVATAALMLLCVVFLAFCEKEKPRLSQH